MSVQGILQYLRNTFLPGTIDDVLVQQLDAIREHASDPALYAQSRIAFRKLYAPYIDRIDSKLYARLMNHLKDTPEVWADVAEDMLSVYLIQNRLKEHSNNYNHLYTRHLNRDELQSLSEQTLRRMERHLRTVWEMAAQEPMLAAAVAANIGLFIHSCIIGSSSMLLKYIQHARDSAVAGARALYTASQVERYNLRRYVASSDRDMDFLSSLCTSLADGNLLSHNVFYALSQSGHPSRRDDRGYLCRMLFSYETAFMKDDDGNHFFDEFAYDDFAERYFYIWDAQSVTAYSYHPITGVENTRCNLTTEFAAWSDPHRIPFFQARPGLLMSMMYCSCADYFQEHATDTNIVTFGDFPPTLDHALFYGICFGHTIDPARLDAKARAVYDVFLLRHELMGELPPTTNAERLARFAYYQSHIDHIYHGKPFVMDVAEVALEL